MILINLILNMNVWLVQKRRNTGSMTLTKWSKYPTIGSQRIYSRADAWGWCAEMCIEGRLRGVSAVQCCWYCAVQCVVQWVGPLLHSLPPGKPLMPRTCTYRREREQLKRLETTWEEFSIPIIHISQKSPILNKFAVQGWIFVQKNLKLSIHDFGVFWNCLLWWTRLA